MVVLEVDPDVRQVGAPGERPQREGGRVEAGADDLHRPGGQVGPLTGEEAQLAQEPAVAVHGNERVSRGVRAHDLHLAVGDHPEVVGVVGRTERMSPGRDVAFFAVGRQLGQFGLAEGGGGGIDLLGHPSQISEGSPRRARERRTRAAWW